MRPLKTSRTPLLIGGAAVLAILSAGGLWLATREGAPPAPTAEAHVENGAAEGEGAPAIEGRVELTAEQIAAAGIVIATATPGGGGETRIAGRVEPMVDARASVAAIVGGRVERVVVAPGQSVRVGQPLATLVSGEAAGFSAETAAASAMAEAAQRAHQRDQNLFEAGVVSRQEVETSHAQALAAAAQARAARARAAAAGSPSASGRFSVVSPISGVVTNVQVGPGGFVAAGGVVADVTNPARIELVFNAPPQLAATVRPGATLRVHGPSSEFQAVVTGVAADAGTAGTGAAVIRARPQGVTLPPAGSPVTGAVVTGQTGGAVTVPSEAIQTVENQTVVFVQVPGGFQATPVLTGRHADGRTEILRGLAGSERIAGVNAFLLKAELAKGAAEHRH